MTEEVKATWQEPEETEASFEKVKAYLGEKDIHFGITHHKPVMTCEEAAEVRGVPLSSGAKAMLLKDTGKKLSNDGITYYLAVSAANCKFSSKQFKKVINCKSFRFATPEEVHQTTGCLPGAVPPFGKVFGVPVWVDRSLGKNEQINFNCGLRTASVSMKYEDYIKAEQPNLHVFTDEEIALGNLPVEEKKEEKKDSREAKKAERLAARQQKVVKAEVEVKKDPNDTSAHLFGERELNRSGGDPELRHTKTFTNIKDIDATMAGQVVTVRARLHHTRGKGNLIFIVMREQCHTIQTVLQHDDSISKGMVNYASKVPKESIIEVIAKVSVPENPVETCTQKVELAIQEFWIINKSAPMLPFQIEDASRLVTNQAAEIGGAAGTGEEESKDNKKGAVVMQDIRLNNRVIDLRVPTNQAIFKLQAGVCRLFREYLQEKGFIEIHSPKMIGGQSEGGSNVFKFKYFGQDACLAQSPQLYKQMALMADFDRVFEIGPVFRAEDSNTNRHLCEFTGLDMEMTIKEHYFEVLDTLADMLHHIFEGLSTKYKTELDIIKQQYPFEDFKVKYPVVKMHFKDGVAMLREAGYTMGDFDDLSTENEKMLGKLVKEKHDTDFYMLYGYPAAVRPFYTMLDPTDSNYTNSYDFFMRGEEITSGAQRIHDPEMLTERAKFFEIPVSTIQDYIDAFKYGAPAHGGAGFGLERIVKFYCNLHNIRKSSLFPRDPKRIKP